jgi:hypothetical protein
MSHFMMIMAPDPSWGSECDHCPVTTCVQYRLKVCRGSAWEGPGQWELLEAEWSTAWADRVWCLQSGTEGRLSK